MSSETLKRPPLTLARPDPSSYDKSEKDLVRHNELLEKAIKEKLPYFVKTLAEKTDKGEKVKVRLETLELPRMQFEQEGEGQGEGESEEKNSDGGNKDDKNTKGQGGKDDKEGEGEGKSEKGKQDKKKKGNKKDGKGEGGEDGENGAGKEGGNKKYEEEIPIDEIDKIVFNELGLKHLNKYNPNSKIKTKEWQYNDYRKKKTTNNLSANQTIFENMKRNLAERGRADISRITPEDYVVLIGNEERLPNRKAKVFLITDVSISMRTHQQKMRTLTGWSTKFLKEKYEGGIDLNYVVHDVRAEKVNEEQFKTISTNGGTKCSTALELVNKELPEVSSAEDVYLFYFSDGENTADDNKTYLDNLKKLLDKGITQFAFIKLTHHSTGQDMKLSDLLKDNIKDERFDLVNAQDEDKLLDVLRVIFPKEENVYSR